jgi:hypothetical protein
MNIQSSDLHRYCAVAEYAERHPQPTTQLHRRQVNPSDVADNEVRLRIAMGAEQGKQR